MAIAKFRISKENLMEIKKDLDKRRNFHHDLTLGTDRDLSTASGQAKNVMALIGAFSDNGEDCLISFER